MYKYFFGFKGNNLRVDLTEDTGRYARLVNHSKKDPNCATKVRLGKQSPPDPVCEKKDIEKGEIQRRFPKC